MRALKVLYVATEYAPLLKVGGLADVAAALPRALAMLGAEVRLLIPLPGGMTDGPAPIWSDAGCALHPIDAACGTPVWLLDTPRLRRRSGIYADRNGRPYEDDAECALELCRMATAIADDALGLGWRPDVVHCNEWQTALIPMLLMQCRVPAASVLTIHNLAHQGLFPLATGARLGLPRWALHDGAAEYWGQLSFLKAGLVFADRLTTVSPGYAREILTPAFGAGLDGVLRERAEVLDGILNGLDEANWNPQDDPLIETPYSATEPAGKRRARSALLRELAWAEPGSPATGVLAAMVGRLVPQKGADLVVDALPELLAMGLRIVVLGSGDAALERSWREAAERYPAQVAVRLGFDEALAHRIFAASDLFLMPSRFEPCGLAQMSAMRYGAIPVVNPVGGLGDTVIDAGPSAQPNEDGDGFHMVRADAAALVEACRRAVAAHADRRLWAGLMQRAMSRRFDWGESARLHLQIYRAAMQARAAPLALDAGQRPSDARAACAGGSHAQPSSPRVAVSSPARGR